MRIVFIGCVEFSRHALEHILAIGGNVVGVCTRRESTLNSDFADLTPLCDAHGVPWCDAPDINSPDTVARISEWQPDVIFCFGWSRLLKKQLLDIPRLGVVGFHPAALPANRGRHPLIWALALGLKETATTFFFMDDGADSGEILSQQLIAIDDADDAGMLYAKMTRTALKQIEEFLPQLASGTELRSPQDMSKANVWRKRGRADGVIDWRMSATSIHNLVRALTHPYVGASFDRDGIEHKVWKTARFDGVPENAEPGKIVGTTSGAPIIKCGEQGIILLDVEPRLSFEVGTYV